MARLATRCLSAVTAYDRTLENVETLESAQVKFDEILNSSSLDVACEKIASLAKAKELDSSLILLINSAWASAKESPTMKNEVMLRFKSYHIYYFLIPKPSNGLFSPTNFQVSSVMFLSLDLA